MKKYVSLILCSLFVLSSHLLSAQSETWDVLSDVEFKRRYFESENEYFLTPVFGSQVRELEGQEISVKGYIIPLDFDSEVQILSAFPYSSCFFCGGAGPESVIEIHTREKITGLQPDQIVTFKGILHLNSDDIEMLNYILKDAVLVE